jgi:hypothetical protein
MGQVGLPGILSAQGRFGGIVPPLRDDRSTPSVSEMHLLALLAVRISGTGFTVLDGNVPLNRCLDTTATSALTTT